jgi:hypothetical protein
VRSRERVTKQHRRQDRLEPETTAHQWIWVTTLDAKAFPAPVVRSLGHDRWKQENNGWNDLTQNWALKHGFLHACKHRPKNRTPGAQPGPVPNQGLMAVMLILCLAFALASAFTLLHSKLFRLYRLSLREVSRQLYRSLWQRQPPIRAPS